METLLSLLSSISEEALQRFVERFGAGTLLRVVTHILLSYIISSLIVAYTSPHFERELRNHFDLKEGVFIDVGAHIGRYTVLSAPFFIKIVSVEPDPYNFWVLMKNVLLNRFDNVVLFRCGCFSENGEGILHLSPINFGGHSL
ncbi:MAG: FkbM family methyltransferase [Nitrososphaeria archaeon]